LLCESKAYAVHIKDTIKLIISLNNKLFTCDFEDKLVQQFDITTTLCLVTPH